MRLSYVIKALGSLCLVFVNGFPVSDEDFPQIIGPKCVQIKVRPGEQLVLHCDAFANSAEDEALIYWLVNDTFPEDTHSSDRIVELNENIFEDGAILQRSLLLKRVTAEDLNTTFRCVVTNAVGMAQRNITLKTATTCGCSSK